MAHLRVYRRPACNDHHHNNNDDGYYNSSSNNDIRDHGNDKSSNAAAAAVAFTPFSAGTAAPLRSSGDGVDPL
jgi:hypothetical protein